MTVTCDRSPGAGFCYALNDAILDAGNACSGDNQCDAVWMGESGSDANVLSQFEMAALPTDKVSQDIGKLAFYLATEICSDRSTGDSTYLDQVYVAEIKLMPRLLFLQKSAGVTNSKSCKVSI